MAKKWTHLSHSWGYKKSSSMYYVALYVEKVIKVLL